MNKIILILLTSYLYSFSSTGYFENNIDIISKNNINYFGYSKIRYDVFKNISDDFSFNMAFIAKNNYGKKYFNINDLIPGNSDDIFNNYNSVINDSIFCDQLYFTYKYSNFKLLIGRQPLYFGTGYIWNPVNNISYKNTIDPSYDVLALNAVRLHYFSPYGDYDFILIPEDNGKEVSFYSSLGTTLLNQSVRVYASRFLSSNINLENETLDCIENGIGFSQSGTVLFGIAMWTELYSYLDSKMNDWMIGFDYTFDSGIYMMLERYHQDVIHGFSSTYQSETILNYLAGNIRSIGSDYSFISFGISMDNYTRLSLQSIYNLSDGSNILFPHLDYSLMDDVDLSLSLYIFNGDQVTEFGLNNWGFRSRIQIYF